MSGGSKVIEVVQITNVEHKPWKHPKVDDNDVPIREGDECPECGHGSRLVLEASDTVDILKQVAYMMPAGIKKQNDPLRTIELWNAISNRKDGRIVFHDETYQWIMKALNRPVPIKPEMKKMGVTPITYAQFLWDTSAEWITNQIRDADDKKTYELPVEDDEEESEPPDGED